ncbi:MAG: hypothetical protein R3C17_14360 [Planctomycetaceae bacterium]
MNWRLIFSGLKSPGWEACVVLAIVVAVGLSFWLLRLERKLVSRPVGWTLLTLRMLILISLLLTLSQPLLTQRFDGSQNGKIIIAIDASLSMETQDHHASRGEKLRWAQALGMLGNAETNSLIDGWVVAAESGKEPDWLGAEGRGDERTPAEQSLSEARARQVQDALDELAGMSRVEFVSRLLQAKPNELLIQLGDVLPIDLRVFAAQQRVATPAQLASSLDLDRASLLPDGTDVLQLLTSVTSEENASEIRGVVLMTDGRQTAPGDVTQTAQQLATLKIPVYAVPIGSKLPPRDLSIAAVEAPEVVFLNDHAQIRAVVSTSGFEEETLKFQLKHGTEILEEQSITPVTDSVRVMFDVPADVPGRFDYRLETEIQPGELRADNNVRDVSLQVVDNKARVLLVDRDARWEFRYLKNLLDRDKQVEPDTVLLHQPFLGLLNRPYFPNRLPELEALREQLAVTDLLIMGDVGPQALNSGCWDVIEQAVTRDGLTLIVIPGRNHMPHAFNSPVLTALLPVTESRQRLAEKFRASLPDEEQTAWRLSLSVDAANLPMFRLSADPAAPHNTFADLPGHPWIYGGIPKPGAAIWATASLPGVDVAPEPTILHHDYGFGQVVWMGLDSTWRWRRRAGDEWHYRFWGQLIRWAARNKAAAGNENVRMSLSDVVIDETETIEATVRWSSRLATQLKGATVEVVATRIEPPASNGSGTTEPTDASATPPEYVTRLTPSADTPGRYAGRLPRFSEGVWQVKLRATGSPVNLDDSIAAEILVRRHLSQELANVSCNRELLTQLAEITSGAVVEPYEASRLIDLVRPQDRTENKLQEVTLWDHWLVLLIFFPLLMSEWVLRKLNGLP